MWLDAPVGYMASFKHLCAKRPDLSFEEYWERDENTELVHFIGKDIIHLAVFQKNDERTTYNMIYLDGKKWVKQTKDDIVANMISTWIKWWPTQRYKSKEEELKWAQANVDSFADLKKSAEEVLHQCKVYKLFNV